MRTIVLGPPPVEIEALIARRHALGLDKFDEVWEGEYHMAPMAHSSHGRLVNLLPILLEPMARRVGLFSWGPFNLGEPGDFRVPDGGLFRADPGAVWVASAAMVIEIESPDDETWQKLDFYAARNVEEILIVSAAKRSVTWLVLTDGSYARSDHSALLGPDSADLAEHIEWPTTGEL